MSPTNAEIAAQLTKVENGVGFLAVMVSLTFLLLVLFFAAVGRQILASWLILAAAKVRNQLVERQEGDVKQVLTQGLSRVEEKVEQKSAEAAAKVVEVARKLAETTPAPTQRPYHGG